MLKKILSLVKQGFQSEVRSFQTRKRIRRLLASRPVIELEIGACKRRPGVNLITMDQDERADLPWDLGKGIPFPDCSISFIYTSHTLEHFFFHEMMALLGDCFRVLKPGGQISICVPNARLYADAYVRQGPFPAVGREWRPGLSMTGSSIDILNYTAYMRGHHRYMFDEENLVNIFGQCGFESPHLRSFDAGLDIASRDYESIYAMATKPAQIAYKTERRGQ